MPDFTDLLKTIKQSSKETNDADKPVHVCFGKVTSTSPLNILVEQKITLGSAQLVLTKSVSDDALVTGDKVLLLRVQGGQKYVVIDRVV